ncbi:hypothetical protein EJ04DRAFT_367207 [Polyplosphaeria fusca]|uniref:Acyltransferase 3 domain-containing protein n=1 Tax=Polyplosphaeria fusca TaxID=682080 RepID=A0A9P4QTW6_9PLEO|nr:hypothetical protein EJ04DRAFT_367207 [Polyplosphaeria fusca]
MPPSRPSTHHHHLTNLRTTLTTLVLLHHSSLPYGGAGSTPFYTSAPPFSSPAIVAFNMLNQSFFMGTFFLVSGYLSAGSADAKGKGEFLGPRAKRLGVPVVVGSVLGPGVCGGVRGRVLEGRGWGEVLGVVWEGVRGVRGVRGAVWYCALLGIFDVGLVVVRWRGMGKRKRGGPIKMRSILAGLVATSLASFGLRVWYPVGTKLEVLDLNVGYVPQYVMAYCVGAWAYKTGTTLENLTTSRTRIVLLSVAAALVTIGFGILKHDVDTGAMRVRDVFQLSRGGFSRYALLYAGCNEFTGAWIASLILPLFKKRLNRWWGVGTFDVGRYSYPSFLVHLPVLLYIQCSLDKWIAGGLLKTVVVGSMAIPASWCVGWGLVKGVERAGAKGYV